MEASTVEPQPALLPADLLHVEKTRRLTEDVRNQLGRSETVHVDKGGVRHVVPLPGDARFAGRALDVSDFTSVLSIDVAGRTCTVEPGVTFSRLVDATLARGLLPPVVPELEGITVGGAVAGCSVESMSFKYGGLHDNCLEYEVVDGTGELRTLSREREPELFDMIHGSYGTLGVLTRVTMKLVPAKPYVQLRYQHLSEATAFYTAIREATDGGRYDFIDGFAHGPRHFTLALGQFTDDATGVSQYGRSRPYYKSTRTRESDVLGTRDYLFRFDADCHWLSRTVPPLEWRPVRKLVGKWVLGSTNLIRWSNRLSPILAKQRRPPVVCDVFIPGRRFVDFLAWYQHSFDYYPLWVVPYRPPAPYPWINPAHAVHMKDDLIIDCAVYGKPNSHPEVDASVQLEERTFELGGIKTLISRNHYSPERFWEIYDPAAYRDAKRRLDPHGVFPELYEKMMRAR